MSEKNTFESSITRLEEVVRLLEKGDAPLDEALALFEEGYMSIDTDGSILPSVLLSDDMHQLLSRTRLNPQFMNEQRMEYLDFHRHQVFADR